MQPAILPGGSGISRRMDMAVTDLPQPELADDRQRLAGLDVEGEAVDGAVDAVRRAEVRLQVLDLEQGHGDQSRLAMRGSSASRRPSPSRLTASTVSDRKMAGKKMM